MQTASWCTLSPRTPGEGTSGRLPAGHGGAMKDRNDPRDVRPRIGSPLGVYLAPVTAAGLAALVAAAASVPVAGLLHPPAGAPFLGLAGLAPLGAAQPARGPRENPPH